MFGSGGKKTNNRRIARPKQNDSSSTSVKDKIFLLCEFNPALFL